MFTNYVPRLWIYCWCWYFIKTYLKFTVCTDYNFIFTDIKECAVSNGGCSGECINDSDGSYSCSCGAGYELYAYPDFNNISLADGETGTRAGDKIRINHTCVSKWLHINFHNIVHLKMFQFRNKCYNNLNKSKSSKNWYAW